MEIIEQKGGQTGRLFILSSNSIRLSTLSGEPVKNCVRGFGFSQNLGWQK